MSGEAFVEVDFEIVDDAKRPPKWIAGEPIETLGGLDAAFAEKRRLFMRHKSYHWSFVANQNYGALRSLIARKQIRVAVINPMYVNWLRQELEAVTIKETHE
jgi:hypothetical protein